MRLKIGVDKTVVNYCWLNIICQISRRSEARDKTNNCDGRADRRTTLFRHYADVIKL
jgi:hypothetical protein